MTDEKDPKGPRHAPDGDFMPGRSSALVESGEPRKEVSTNPKYQEFVGHMTDPTSPGFWSPNKAAELSGFTGRTGYDLMKRPDIQAALSAIQKERMTRGMEVVEYLQTFDMQGARELVDQLFHGKEELRPIDPEKEFGPGVKDVLQPVLDDDGNVLTTKDGDVVAIDYTKRLREINNHNKQVNKAAEVRLRAAELHLAYLLGRPEQSVKLRQDGGKPDVLGMTERSDEELMILMAAAKELLESRGKGVEAEEVEVKEGDYDIEEGR